MSVRLASVKAFDESKPESYIFLTGQWLSDAGFTSGKKFIVEIEDKDRIVLKIVEEEV